MAPYPAARVCPPGIGGLADSSHQNAQNLSLPRPRSRVCRSTGLLRQTSGFLDDIGKNFPISPQRDVEDTQQEEPPPPSPLSTQQTRHDPEINSNHVTDMEEEGGTSIPGNHTVGLPPNGQMQWGSQNEHTQENMTRRPRAPLDCNTEPAEQVGEQNLVNFPAVISEANRAPWGVTPGRADTKPNADSAQVRGLTSM